MKAIELMQKLGELVAEHGDIEVTLEADGVVFVRDAKHAAIPMPGLDDFHVIEITDRKE